MKVYFNGFNLYKQFPSGENLVENLIDSVYNNLTDIEVSYHYVVLLVADSIVLQGARDGKFEFDEKISAFSCSEDRVVVLLNNGDLYKIADGVNKVPRLLDLEDDQITQLSCGSKLAVAVTKLGKVYNIPNKLNFVNTEIIEVKTGREHCLLLDEKGRVYSFGRGSRGQLGHGCLDDEIEPRFIEALGGIKIEAISAGGWHSCALSNEGDVYVWGWNGNGQLGCNNEGVIATPRVIDVHFNVRKICCGSRHTVVLSDDGLLYGCGWNKYNQLKGDKEETYYTMTYLEDFSEKKVTSLKCGPWNTVVLCEE